MKRVCLLTLLWIISQSQVAQAQNGMAFPSANNSFLGASDYLTSSQVNVDLFTGAAQISVPVCDLGSREMSIPVSLIYAGSKGIKLQDYAACVGLGWQLNAGGGISRVVRGFPDEIPNGYLGTGQSGKSIEDYHNNVPGAFVPQGVNNGLSAPTVDGDPDLYFLKTPFFTLEFTFDGYGNAVFTNSTGIQVLSYNFYNSSSYQNSFFKVVDDKGNQYFFGSSSQSIEKTTSDIYSTSYTLSVMNNNKPAY